MHLGDVFQESPKGWSPLSVWLGKDIAGKAIGTDLAYGAITKTVGGWRHLRSGTVDLGVSKWMAFGSVPGALAGVTLLERLDLDVTVVLALVAGALVCSGIASRRVAPRFASFWRCWFAANVMAGLSVLAATGSVVLDSRAAGGRTVSLLPPVHLCVTHVNTLFPAPADVLRRLGSGADALPPSMVLVTGPSRTGDIEQLLTLGAHGPTALHVVLVTDGP